MNKPSITAHMMVKNEDVFIWYAIASTLPFVDKFLICDTGSTDDTIQIIHSFTSPKIEFSQVKVSAPEDIKKIRQEQIAKTKTDWIWVIDGDEIYSQALCEEIVNILKKGGKDIEGIVVGRYDLLGDIYHYQDTSVGTYDLFGQKAHNVLRLIHYKRLKGLHVEGVYPYEGYYDNNDIELIHHDPSKFPFTKEKMFHAMYLKRSSLGGNLFNTFHRNKWKIEVGKKFSVNVTFPEVFMTEKPAIVPSVTKERSIFYNLLAYIITPIKFMKRWLWNNRSRN